MGTHMRSREIQKRAICFLDSAMLAWARVIGIAEKVKLSGEVNKISKEIAELSKSLLEASELRSEEKADNEATLDEAKAGKSSVDKAIEVFTRRAIPQGMLWQCCSAKKS